MLRDRVSFTSIAQIVVGAIRMHALVSHTVNDLVARIADGVVPHLRDCPSDVILRVLDLDESMARMLLLGDGEAALTRIEVWTVQAFVTLSNDPALAEIAIGSVRGGRRRGRGRGLAGLWWTHPRSIIKHSVNDDASRLLNIDELVERLMPLRTPLVDTGLTEVIVWTIEALVPGSHNHAITAVADDVRMHRRGGVIHGNRCLWDGLTGASCRLGRRRCNLFKEVQCRRSSKVRSRYSREARDSPICGGRLVSLAKKGRHRYEVEDWRSSR